MGTKEKRTGFASRWARRTFSIVVCYSVSAFPSFSDECLHYKISPNVEVSVPEWTKSVVQPLKPMDLLHGNVAATMIEEYALSVEANPIEDGYCVVLTGIEANLGYTEFLVQIDLRHRPGTCGYNVTLDHEDQHIAAHLSVIHDSEMDIKRSIMAASESIMPIFVPYGNDISIALDLIERDIQSHPDIILMKQKINAEQEIRNKKVDERDDGRRINDCGIS